MKNKVIVFLITFITVGCFGLFDSGSDRIIGKYIVVWIDVYANQCIAKEFEEYSGSSSVIISDYVFAVGHNKDYIIAKQHPTSGFEGGYEVYTDTTNYFIIKLNQKADTEELFGPLSKIEFDSLREKFNIANIEFDLEYPESW